MSKTTHNEVEKKSIAETSAPVTVKPGESEKFNCYFKRACFAAMCLTVIASIICAVIGTVGIFAPIGTYELTNDFEFIRLTTPDEEEYNEEEYNVCPVEYGYFADGGDSPTYTFTVSYTYEEWENIGENEVFSGFIYKEARGERFVGFTKEADDKMIASAVHDIYADENNGVFTAAVSLAILAVSLAVMAFFGQHFSLYEKCWFLGIMVLATIFSIIFPEDSIGGVSGIVIMLLYLLDTFLNILCELLISKQSKWNFIVSVFVEITEIVTCLVLSYRFATMATTLFFWLPIDIISFINWNRRKNTDKDEEELTKVRCLKGWQEILIIVGIAVWTVVVGYFLSGLDIVSDLFGGNEVLANIVIYIDACASAVGIVNGLAILFRFREQWIAWYICSILEAVINILAGQYILLILKFGYLTNTTYGYIKWSQYIKAHPELVEERSFF